MNEQLTQAQFRDNSLYHLLTTESLPRGCIITLLNKAFEFKKSKSTTPTLAGKTILLFFQENSTRTKNSFLLASKRLGAEVVDFGFASSSTSKGETDIDTIQNLEAMGVDAIITRNVNSGYPLFLAKNSLSHIINAGDGAHAHPSQALLDLMTMVEHFGEDLSKIKIAIIGDILKSRVARSNIFLLASYGIGQINIVCPYSLLPKDFFNLPNVNHFVSLEAGIRDCDAVMCLRIQYERMKDSYISEEFPSIYGLNTDNIKLAKPEAIILHPGPINRGVELTSEVADSSRSLILPQVENGVFMRMSILDTLLNQRCQI